jgi:hypothetical protein
MNYINPKKQSEHAGDYDVVNNGGITVCSGRGAVPSEKTGDSTTKYPDINKSVNESRL